MCIILSLNVFSLVQYTGAPTVPYLIYGHVEWNNQFLAGVRLQVTNVNTGFSKVIATDGLGYWQEEATNWLTVADSRPPVIYGDTIKIKALDGCGTGDICEKTFISFYGSNKDYAAIDLSLTGTLVCPPADCPVCNSGGGGSCSGGGGGACIITESACRNKYPCNPVETTTTTVMSQECPTLTYTESKCRELYPVQSCEQIPVECPEGEGCLAEEEPTGIWTLISLILGIIVGGSAIYLTITKTNRIKAEKDDKGNINLCHQHPTVSGYHSPDVVHRDTPHKKGELLPKYEKVNNVWRYMEEK